MNKLNKIYGKSLIIYYRLWIAQNGTTEKFEIFSRAPPLLKYTETKLVKLKICKTSNFYQNYN